MDGGGQSAGPTGNVVPLMVWLIAASSLGILAALTCRPSAGVNCGSDSPAEKARKIAAASSCLKSRRVELGHVQRHGRSPCRARKDPLPRTSSSGSPPDDRAPEGDGSLPEIKLKGYRVAVASCPAPF
jgi:hypothetical protein